METAGALFRSSYLVTSVKEICRFKNYHFYKSTRLHFELSLLVYYIDLSKAIYNKLFPHTNRNVFNQILYLLFLSQYFGQFDSYFSRFYSYIMALLYYYIIISIHA